MCIIGADKETRIIPESEAVVGFKVWKKFKNNEKLISQSSTFVWEPGEIWGDIKDPERGVFSWLNNNYNYNYYNYNHNYSYYHYYYNHNYSYYHYYYNHNYSYYHYNIFGEIYQYGEVHTHDQGYRSEFAKPKLFLNLSHKDGRDIKFVNHFNEVIDNLSKLYNVPTESFDDYILKVGK